MNGHILINNPLSHSPVRGFVQINTDLGPIHVPVASVVSILEVNENTGSKDTVVYFQYRGLIASDAAETLEVSIQAADMSRKQVYDFLNQVIDESHSVPSTQPSK